VPIHATVALAPSNAPHARSAVVPRHPSDVATVNQPPPVVAAPAWRIAEDNHDPHAYDLLSQSPGGVPGAMDGATSAGELLKMRDVAQAHGDATAATHAYERIIQAFPATQEAQVAAISLANIYDKQGKVDEAAKIRAIIKLASFEEDAACKQMRA